MDGFLSLNPERDDARQAELAERAFATIGSLTYELASALTIAGALPEEELNACPYPVRKALYDYAEQQFRFQTVVLRWHHERAREAES